MKLSVIIPTHSTHKSLFALLKSLEKQSFGQSAFEILVVSNLQNDKLRAKLARSEYKQFSVRYFEKGQKGANAARNLGVRNAKGDLMLLLDDDCVVDDPNYLQRICDLHDKHPEASGVGGFYGVNDKGLSSLQKAYNINANRWLVFSSQNNQTQLVGGNASYKSFVFRDRIKFNENIVYGGTETELNYRLKNEGHKLMLVGDLVVSHKPNLSFVNLVYKSYLQGVGKKRLKNEFGIDDKAYKSQEYVGFNESWFVNFYLKSYNSFFNLGFGDKTTDRPLSKFRVALAALVHTGGLFGVSLMSVLLFFGAPFIKLYNFSKANNWRLTHFIRHRVAPAVRKLVRPFEQVFHFFKKHIWRISYFLKHKVLHFFVHKVAPVMRSLLWPFQVVYHAIKKRVWIISHFLFHKVAPVMRSLLWPFQVVYHAIKKRVWIISHFLFHKIAPVMRSLLWPFQVVYHAIKKRAWIISHFIKYRVLHFFIHKLAPIFRSLVEWVLRATTSSIAITIVMPWHFIKKYSWLLPYAVKYKILIPVYYRLQYAPREVWDFVYNKILWNMLYPVRKIYYVMEFQFQKRVKPLLK